MIKICFVFRNNPKASVRHLGMSLNLKTNNGDRITKENAEAKKKQQKFVEREREQRHHANNLFKLLTENSLIDNLEKIESNTLNPTNNVIKTEKEMESKVASKKTHNIVSRLNELIKSAESFETLKKHDIEFTKPKQKHDDKPIENLISKDKTKKDLMESIKDIASNLGGDVKKTQKELVDAFQYSIGKPHRKLMTISDLKNFIDEMKVQAEEPEDTTWSIHEIIKSQNSKAISDEKLNKMLSSNKRLNIFSKETLEDKNAGESNLQIWNYLETMSLFELKATPPRNYFQELIIWTQQGKLWHFPIDNEQGLDEERKIHFSEHIFLDKYLEPWCPHGGPIRHFMELVITALSKNSYLSVSEKKEHLMWYKNYFESKKKLLIQLGAMPQSKQVEQ